MAFYDYNVKTNDVSSTDRCKMSQALDLEYRGEGTDIDVDNIAAKLYQTLNINKLKDFATYMCTYRRVVDLLASTYTRPPTRYFRKGNGKPVSVKTKDYIDDLYDELHYDDFMSEVEADTVRSGTTFVTSVFDEEKIRLLKLTPSVQTLQVEWHKQYAQDPIKVSYTIGDGTNIQWVVWLKDAKSNYIKELRNDVNGEAGDLISAPTLLDMKVFPWTVLRFITDVRRSWGPVDQTSWSFHRSRSLLLAKLTEAPMHEMYQLLLMQGFSKKDATAAIKTITSNQTIIAPPEVKEGVQLTKDVKYIYPSAVTPQAIWEVYDNIYSHYLITKGISRKNFETSNDPQSAAAQRQSDKYLGDVQTKHKRPLGYFEKELFERIKSTNNEAGLTSIPEDTYLVVDWRPDPITFNNADEKVRYYQAGFIDKTSTPIDKIVNEKDVSKEDAQAIYDDNVKWWEEYKGEQIVEDAEQETPEQVEEVEIGEKENPYKHKVVDGKHMWTWGNNLKWYEGTEDEPPQKLKDIVKAIFASGYKEH